MDIHRAFRLGAEQLARDGCKYTDLHKSHGMDEHHWTLLTQDEAWTPDQARQMRSILASAIEISMTIAGMPAVPMPGQYAAATIAIIVSPINRMIAAMKCPDTFDADAASGLLGTSEVKEMSKEQLMALVLAYSGGYPDEPPAHKLPEEVTEAVKQANKK